MPWGLILLVVLAVFIWYKEFRFRGTLSRQSDERDDSDTHDFDDDVDLDDAEDDGQDEDEEDAEDLDDLEEPAESKKPPTCMQCGTIIDGPCYIVNAVEVAENENAYSGTLLCGKCNRKRREASDPLPDSSSDFW